MTNAELLDLFEDQVKNHSASIFPPALVRNWFDEGQIDIVRRTECISTDNNIASVADQRGYNLPTDVLRILHIKFYDGTNHFPLDGVSENEMEEYGDYPDETSATPSTHYFVKLGATPELNLYPTPSASQANAIKVRYLQRPTKLEPGGSNPVIPEPYHRLIVLYALWRCLQKDVKNKTGDRYKAEYEQQLMQMQHDLRNWDRKTKPKMLPYTREHKRRSMGTRNG